MRSPARVALSTIAGLALAISSRWYERIGRAPAAWDDELCSLDPPRSCREGVLKGGWPLPYLVDAPGVSVVGKLSIGEDHFQPWAFAADAAIAGAVVWLLSRARERTRRRDSY